MNILVLGGTAFIGPYVVRALAQGGHNVTVFHRGKTKADLPDSVRSIHGNRSQMRDFKAEFAATKPDVVVDMLAMFEDDAYALLDTFKGVAKRLVLISSMDVYRVYGQINGIEEGEIDPNPFNEESPVRTRLYPYRENSKQPGDFFDRYDKIPVENILSSQPELPVTILRLPAVYGPGDKQHRVGFYLNQMEGDGENKGEIALTPAQAKWRWTRGYVEDVAAAIALAATDERASGRLYNVGEPSAWTEVEWVSTIAKAADWEGPLSFEAQGNEEEEHLDYSIHLEADTSRIRNELGFAESVPRDEAIKRSVQWEHANKPSG